MANQKWEFFVFFLSRLKRVVKTGQNMAYTFATLIILHWQGLPGYVTNFFDDRRCTRLLSDSFVSHFRWVGCLVVHVVVALRLSTSHLAV